MEYLHFRLLAFILFQTHLYLATSKMGGLKARADKEALLSFKLQVTDPQNALSGWTKNSSHCTWYGVSCSSKGSRVQSLHLSRLGLGGTLTPQLSNLTSLHTLNLSHNLFHGQVQLEFSRLTHLQHIDLRNNSINGTIPAVVSDCHNLETLRLEGNKFTGKLPPELGSLQKLKTLHVSINNLTGSIPPTFGNLSSLTSLALARNQLLGEIPSELGCLSNLQYFQLSGNHLSGEIPSIFNISSLVFFSVTQNYLGGKLPNDIVQALPNLRQLYLAQNSFEGIIPGSLSNASGIEHLDLSVNRFHGPIPLFGNMKKLIWLNLGSNFLSSTTELNFQLIDSLTNCKELEVLKIFSNQLGGEFPSSVANLSSNLQHFCIANNLLTGSFPQGFEKFHNLISLSIEQNAFTGEIPKNIATLQNLQSFSVFQNMLSGEFPDIFGNFSQLVSVQMDNNKFTGKIPSSLGACHQLLTLDLASNRLNGSIPKEIFMVSSLTNLVLSHNRLWGSLPGEVGELKQLQVVDVSDNQLSGNLTASIGGCVTLLFLNMSRNNVSGAIPGSVGKLTSLEVLDLSYNKFSGSIPGDLENLLYLQKLDLSFNHLEGEVPKGKVFLNLSVTTVQGNNGLCSGDQEIARNLELPQCKTKAIKKFHLLKILVSAAGVTLFICLIFCFVWALIPGKKKTKDKGAEPSPSLKGLPPMISYSDIQLATSNFAAENLIGKGGFGSVYKGTFITGDNEASTNNITLAVKVLDLQQSKAIQSFLAECETLRNVRHRNLVKIITSCSSIDHKGDEFKALVMEFMPNGNLDKWLYPEDMESGLSLTLLQRLNIAIDVASAMDYLHNDCQQPVVHCDLKPANVLLDENMTAHVGDFGLARFLLQYPSTEESSTIGVKGSIGYIAPEYGLGGKASTSGDVYSFGILLLEMLIAKKPTDGMFKEGLSLNKFASGLDSSQALETADPRLFKDYGRTKKNSFDTYSIDSSKSTKNEGYWPSQHEECLSAMIRVGLCCATPSAKDRLSMTETLAKLHEIKKSLLN